VTYERAISLLGFTDATLLDDAIDAIAAGDGASLFSVVGRVVETGHEPRRFVEDLLERLRDLIVLAASGASGAQALAVASEDQQERMADQARRLGLGRASRTGDLVNDALTAMIGATSPRLHLELLCARIIAADTAPPTSARQPVPATATAPPPSQAATTTPAPRATAAPSGAPGGSGLAAARAAVVAAREESATEAIPHASAPPPEPARPATTSVPQAPAPVASTPTAPEPTVEFVRAPTGDVAGGPADSELVRRRWPEVLGTLERRRVTWAMVSQSAQVASVEAGVLKIAFDNPALASRFGAGPHSENLALAVRETLGLHVRVEPVVGPAEPGSAAATGASASPGSPGASAQEPPLPHQAPADDEDMADDDEAAPAAHLTGADVIASMLGGTVVDD
jgi:DNA polymerase-3 subunit gamma/tau